jgi:hypothetical protein
MSNKRISQLIEHPPAQPAADSDEIVVNTNITGDDNLTVRTTTRMALAKLLRDQNVARGFELCWDFESLRLIPVAEDNKVAFVLGNLAKGDGQGGIYYYDHESDNTDDGISVAKPAELEDTDFGRWHQFL